MTCKRTHQRHNRHPEHSYLLAEERPFETTSCRDSLCLLVLQSYEPEYKLTIDTEPTDTKDWTYACHRPVSASESTNFASSFPNNWTVTVLLSGNCSISAMLRQAQKRLRSTYPIYPEDVLVGSYHPFGVPASVDLILSCR